MGIAVPVGLVMIAATVLLIQLLFVIHKKRAKKHKQSGKIYIVFEDCQLNYMFSLFQKWLPTKLRIGTMMTSMLPR